MQRIEIKPLSVNEAWQGKRFKTKKYHLFIRELTLLLKPIKLPPAPYELTLKFGFSSSLSDIDNPIKMVIDIMQKKYNFNDKDIFKLNVSKEIVSKGNEFIEIDFITYYEKTFKK